VAGALHIGIDISGKANVAQFMDADGELVRNILLFSNDWEGLEMFLNEVATLVQKHHPDTVNIGMEATGFYWWHLQEALKDVQLGQSVVKIYTINPAMVKNFKKAYKKLPKTDAIDAWVIADKIRFGRVSPLHPGSLIYAPLARLTRLRYTIKKNIRSDKSRALDLVFLKFSTYRQAAGDKMFRKASLDMLDEFTVEEIAKTPLEELVEFVLTQGNNRFAEPEEFVKELKKAARNSYRLNPKMEDAVSIALSMTVENIRFMESQCKRLEKVIAKELQAIPQTLNTIPGIGETLAAGIIAEIGDIKRFKDEKALAQFAGLTWHIHKSGPFEAEETSLTKAGNVFLRYYLVEAANSLRLHNSEYAAFYQRKYNESKKHRHKRALVLTARKFTRLVFALLSKGQIYQKQEVSC